MPLRIAVIAVGLLVALPGSAADQKTAEAANSPSASAPGDTSFDAADRLAIVNLFGAYAQAYDAGKPDEFLAVFTDDVELKYMSGDKLVAEGLAQVTAAMPGRMKAFAAANIQRRHALTSQLFSGQTDRAASGRLYFQVFSIAGGGAPSVAATGYYEFTAVKQAGIWKFSRWIAHGDQSAE
jgi:hypothetical protein